MISAEEHPRDHFAGRALDYDRWYHTSTGSFIDRVESDLAFSLCPPREGERVLDAGCGTGNFSLKLARRGCVVTGADISPDMLARARDKAAREGLTLRLVRADIASLPMPDDTYDSVYSMTAVEFVPNLERAQREMMRVLRPGGRLLIGTIAGDGPWGQAYAKRAEENPDSIFRHARFPTLEEFSAIDRDNLEDVGECLYIPPHAPEEDFTLQEERRRRGRKEAAGFFCVLWRKPAATTRGDIP
ncbi:MAG: class I SAM-dependent methyltransferase [Bacillota bacterium]